MSPWPGAFAKFQGRTIKIHQARAAAESGTPGTILASGPEGILVAAATGDVVVYTDADLPFDMRELHKALRLMRQYEADVISAYRFDRTGEGWVRVVYSALYNLLVRVLFGVRMRDVNFAFKVVRRHVFRDIALKSEGSFIDAELVVRAKKLGYSIFQFGVDYFPRTRGVSTLSSPSVIVKILREAFALRRELNALQPVKSA
jgi:hypothetical protein